MRTSAIILCGGYVCTALARSVYPNFRNDSVPSCRYLPGDPGWPSESSWSNLNSSVGGRLIATIPLGSPCHEPSYNAAECGDLKENWAYPQTHFDSSSSIVAPFFQNQSCDPFTSKASPCRIGNYVNYAVEISSAADVAAGLRFAQRNNVRVVIKNTGHDLLGRSTGKGGLGIWTHRLNSVSLLDYQASSYSGYSGPAMKVGAGAQSWEAYQVADAAKVRIVGGTCPTVGLAGGYTQSGGHSLLSSIYGLAADQVLEWEVVLADGSLVVASPEQYPDLYWALSGGGAGTYGVVMSMTIRVHPDTPVTGASLAIFQQGVSDDKYWDAITAFHAATPSWTAVGGSTAYYLDKATLFLQPATFPNRTSDEVTVLMAPLVGQLDRIGVPYSLNITSFPTYYQFFETFFGPLPYGTYTSAQVQGGRLIPRTVLQSNGSNAELTSALRQISSNPDFHFLGVGLNVSDMAVTSNAVLPAWRDAGITLIVAADWDYSKPFATNAAKQALITSQMDPTLASATGNQGGVYMNEGNFERADYQQQYFGDNFGALLAIKKKYDRQDLFYATAMVGSEAWSVAGDGRLCRTARRSSDSSSSSDSHSYYS